MLVRSMLRNRWRQRLALAGVALACVACGREPQAPPEALTPAAVEAALVAAESYFGRRELNEAEAILAKLIEKAPREYRAHELYGQVLYIKGIEMRAQKRPAAELVREAVAEYAHRHAFHERPQSLGAGRSGRGDLSEKAEEFLDGIGR